MKSATNQLVGKGGLGFVMYQLAKVGIDFLSTSQDSDKGDLWVKTPDGVVEVEVKSSTTCQWMVRRSQAQKSPIFIFMSYRLGRCWILRREELDLLKKEAAHVDASVFIIRVRDLPQSALNAWGKISSASVPLQMPGRAPATYKTRRIIKRKLSDGTIKEYTYGPNPDLDRIRSFSAPNGKT